MGFQIQDLFSMEIMENSTFLAGRGGMHREIKRISFSDINEKPSYRDECLMSPGDLCIRSFFGDEGREQYIYDVVSFYIKMQCAGLLVFREFVPTLPESVRILADEKEFPIIRIHETISYAALISEIYPRIALSMRKELVQISLSRLLYENPSPKEITRLYHSLVSASNDPYIVICTNLNQTSSTQQRFVQSFFADSGRQITLLEHVEYQFIVAPYEDDRSLTSLIELVESILFDSKLTHSVGVSKKCTPREFLQGLRQAIDSNQIARISRQNRVFYQDTSIYQLLLHLKHSNPNALRSFSDGILQPLIEYQESTSVDLISTVKLYLEHECNIKEVSALMYQHENSIRFRINKAMSLLGMENQKCTFIEYMSLALKASTLLGSD